MKRTSGNGTSNRQWLYILWNIPFVLIVKVGISGDARKRARDVSESAPGFVFPIFAVYIPFAFSLEKFIHRLFSLLRCPFWGSGKTEWFWFPVAPFAAFIMLTAFLLEYLIWFVVVLLAIWFLSGQPGEPVEALRRMILN